MGSHEEKVRLNNSLTFNNMSTLTWNGYSYNLGVTKPWAHYNKYLGHFATALLEPR